MGDSGVDSRRTYHPKSGKGRNTITCEEEKPTGRRITKIIGDG